MSGTIKNIVGGACLVLVVAGVVVIGSFWSRRPPAEMVLESDRVWTSVGQPVVVEHRVIVPPNVTLTLQPGTTVDFRPHAGLIVRGRLVAEGTPDQRIRLVRHPDSRRLWAGIIFTDAQQENRLRYVDIEAAGSAGHYLKMERSNVTIEHARFAGAEQRVMDIADSSFVLRHSVVEWVGEHEVIYCRGTPVGGRFLVETNTFHANVGYYDIVDIAGCKPPAAIPRFIGNVFLGSGDDGLDIDRTEAYVEGNIFVNFHLKGHKKFSHAISVDNGSQVMITNNLFADNDHAILSRRGSQVTLVNNTFYRCRFAAVCFNERAAAPGGGAIDHCIFWENPASFEFDDQATTLVVSNSVLPEAGRWAGQGNIAGEPKFVDAARGDFRLSEGAPAAGRGANVDPARFPKSAIAHR